MMKFQTGWYDTYPLRVYHLIRAIPPFPTVIRVHVAKYRGVQAFARHPGGVFSCVKASAAAPLVAVQSAVGARKSTWTNTGLPKFCLEIL